MDESGSRARRTDRPMASGRRSVRPRPSQRQAGANSGGSLEPVQPRIPWGRRIGIVIALLALGGTVALAGGFGGRGTPGASASPPASARVGQTVQPTQVITGKVPAAAPVLTEPLSGLTAKNTWSTRTTLPATGIARSDLRLRIYRADKQVLELKVKAGKSMPVRNIPLKSGGNVVTAAFVGPGGEGPRSKAVSITLDDVAPQLSLSQPQDQDIVNAPNVTVLGQTEGGLQITARNLTLQKTLTTSADGTGVFSVALPLASGANDLEITTADALGNPAYVVMTITRGAGVASVQLTLTRTQFRVNALPAAFDVNLKVVDANGRPVDGAAVTFSLSPPGVPTSTYFATTADGHARWPEATLPDGVQAGDGFVTARVTLQSGPTLQDTVPFIVR
jgi:hypothetical protein